MSTRATIKIKRSLYLTEEDEKQGKRTECIIYLYHHYDGYPEGVGADLKEFLKDRKDYANGYWNPELIATDLVRGAIKYNDGEPDMNYRCAIHQHTDSAYGYLIDCDNQTLKCYTLGWDVTEWKEENLVDIPDKVKEEPIPTGKADPK